MLLLPIETSSYDAAPLESLARIWFPEYLPSYLDEDTPSEEKFPGENAAALFLFSVQQLIQRERASLGIWKAVFETRDPPTVIRAGSNSDRFKDRRWLQIGRTLELFRSFEDGWDGHGASAPNQASIAVAQILLHNLELNTTPPRIMIDAEGYVVLTWDMTRARFS